MVTRRKASADDGPKYNQDHYVILKQSKDLWLPVVGAKRVSSTKEGGLVCEIQNVPIAQASACMSKSLTGLFGFKATALEQSRLKIEALRAGNTYIPVPIRQNILNPRRPEPTSTDRLAETYFLDLGRMSSDLSALVTKVFLAHGKRVGKPIPTLIDIHRHFEFVDALLDHKAFSHLRAISFGVGEQRYVTMANLDHIQISNVVDEPFAPMMRRILVKLIKASSKSAQDLVSQTLDSYPVKEASFEQLASHPAFVDCNMTFQRLRSKDGPKLVYSWDGLWKNSRRALQVQSPDVPLIVLLPE